MDQIFFRFNGNVYCVNVPQGLVFSVTDDFVRLPEPDDDTVLWLEILANGCVGDVTKMPVDKNTVIPGKIWNANLVFKEDEQIRVFTDWKSMVPLLNAAAAAGVMFAVLLPDSEYCYLANHGMASLKTRLSPLASSIVKLCKPGVGGRFVGLGQPALELPINIE